jgi:epoxyqueuosine reductase
LVSEGIPATEHRYYVDTGPLLERGWAARAGMGFLGKNAMLISRDHGNWLFLAAILLPSTIPADPPLGGARAFDTDGGARIGLNCGSCTRCIEACPTQALPQPGLLDARRCISYHTIENKGIVPRDLRAAFGNRIYGCDTCLEVCPWNRFAQAGRALLLEARPALADLCLEELLRMTPERFAVTFKGTAIKRIKLRGLLRNACIVAGNRGDSGLVPALEELGAGAEALVRAHAVWALRRIGGPEAESALSRLRATETDPTVLEEFSGPLVSTVA